MDLRGERPSRLILCRQDATQTEHQRSAAIDRRGQRADEEEMRLFLEVRQQAHEVGKVGITSELNPCK